MARKHTCQMPEQHQLTPSNFLLTQLSVRDRMYTVRPYQGPGERDMRTGGTNGYTGGKQAGDKYTDTQMPNGKWKKTDKKIKL